MDKIFIQDLAEGLSKRKGISRADAEVFVRNVFEIIKEALLTEQSIKVKGLGTFKLITVGSRESINVNTGERITIDSHGKISYTPDPILRDRVNKPFADFDTVVLNDETKTEDMERIDSTLPVEEPAEELKEDPVEEPAIEEKPVEEVPVEDPEPVAEEPVAEEPVAEEPESVAEEPVIEEPIVEEPVTEEPVIAPLAASVTEESKLRETPEEEEDDDDDEEEKGSKKWLLWLLFLVVAVLLGWLYLSDNKKDAIPEIAPVEQTEAPQDTIAEPAAPAKPVKSAEELAADYPQIEGGEYWIVGTKATHVLERGDDLSKLALEHYGDKRLINYIIKYNGYSAAKASNLFVGTEVKLPELVKKN